MTMKEIDWEAEEREFYALKPVKTQQKKPTKQQQKEQRAHWDMVKKVFKDEVAADKKSWEPWYRDLLAPLNAAKERMDKRWGTGRLKKLVSPKTLKMFQGVEDDLNDAIAKKDEDKLIRKSTNLIRGLEVMDQEASQKHKTFEVPHVLEGQLPNKKFFGIVRTEEDREALQPLAPNVIYSIDEIAQIIHKFDPDGLGAELKKDFNSKLDSVE